MSIKIEKTENKNEVKLEFTIEAAKFDEAIKTVYSKNAKYTPFFYLCFTLNSKCF